MGISHITIKNVSENLFFNADSDIDYRLINQAAEVKRGDLIVVSAPSIALTSKELHCLECVYKTVT